MKKNYFFSALAIGTLLFAASCSNDEPAPVAQGDGVTFTVQLPDQTFTRANSLGEFGGATANQTLYYQVYDAYNTAGSIVLRGTMETQSFGGVLQQTVHLDLPKGKSYDIIFFATDADNNGVKFDPQNQWIDVDYSVVGQTYNEKWDAFYACKTITVTGPINETVTLYRPFAQLNIGTSDMEAARTGGLDYSQSKITVADVYNRMDLRTGVASNSESTAPTMDFVGAMTNIPKNEEFPVTGYEYLSMNYLLVGANADSDRSLHTVTLALADDDYPTATFDNVPLRRNYRTNIYGALLTSPVDFNVVIDPMFNEPDYDYQVGTEADFVEALADGGVYTLTANLVMPSQYVVAAGKEVTINMAGHSIDFKQETPVMVYGKLTLENGTIYGGNSTSHAGIQVGVSSNDVSARVRGTLVLNNVVVDMPQAWSAIGVWADSNVTISNSEITGRYFGISTDASTNNQNVTITVNNTTINGQETAVLCNQPGTVTLTNCNLGGTYQGVFMRCGTLTIDGGNIVSLANSQTDDWGSGNEVPRAAITLGNKSDAANYMHPVNAKISNVKLSTNAGIPGIYAAGYSATYPVNIEYGRGVDTEDCAISHVFGDNVFPTGYVK